MARKKRGSIFQDDEPGLDISSLIDVCFLLLIYFIVTTTIEASEQDINMKLPSAASPSPDKSVIEPMFIRIEADGVIYTGVKENREQMDASPEDRDLPLLSQRLEIYKSAADLAGNQAVVQISVDSDAEQQRVLDCLNVLSKLEIKSATFTDLIE